MGSGKSRLVRLAALLADRYDILDLIGEGGFGAVYRAKNRRLGRIEALKVLSAQLTEDEDFARRFEGEARVLASLDHPNIVKIFDFGVTEDVVWFSMQFIEGQSLGWELGTSERPMEGENAARIAVSVLDALGYSHFRGVVHRDIKPDNIMMDRHRRPYLMDFGIAKAGDDPVKTKSGFLLGSPAYMSPEQVRGMKVDGRADLYALGATLYKMLSGGLPFAGDDTMGVAMRKLTEEPPALSTRRADVSPDLEAIVMKAIARDIEKRWQTAEQMRGALEFFLKNKDFSAPRSLHGDPEAPTVQSTVPAIFGGAAPETAVTMRRTGAAAVPGGRRKAWMTLSAAAIVAGVVLLVVRRDSRTTSPASQAAVGPAPVATARPVPVEPTPSAASATGLVLPTSSLVATAAAPPRRRATPPEAIAGWPPGSSLAGGSALDPSYRYCATIQPTTYRQAAVKEAPKGFSAEAGDAFRTARTDSARIQVEVSVEPKEPREGEAFQITARIVNGGDLDFDVARVEESAVRAQGGFQSLQGLSLPRTVSIGGSFQVFRGGGVMKGGTTYVKEIRVIDSIGDAWETSVRLIPCP